MSAQVIEKSKDQELSLSPRGLTETQSLFSMAFEALDEGDPRAAREAATQCRIWVTRTDQELPPAMKFFNVRIQVLEGKLREENIVAESGLSATEAADIASRILEEKQKSKIDAWKLAYELYQKLGIGAYKIAAVAIDHTELEFSISNSISNKG